MVGLGWGTQAQTAARGARKFETLGQRNDASVSAMGTAVGFLNAIGPARVQARILQLAEALKTGVGQLPGARLKTSMRRELSAGVCTFEFEGIEKQQIYERLYKEHGIAGAATGGVRLCPHIYNTMEEIERTIAAVGQVTRDA